MGGTSAQKIGIRLDEVSVRFGETVALDRVSLAVHPGEFFSLLGPSGCGKSTLLRVIGGFEAPDAGRVFIGDEEVTKVKPQSRPTAMVFQSYALFPSMTVSENVAYGLRSRGRSKRDAEPAVLVALGRVGLEELGDRSVTQLSGGQQQRVALARAIAVEPGILLFDEPLSNLDVALRERTRRELRAVQREVGYTSVYVTHDQQEALGLSDRIAVMRDGRVIQTGSPENLYAEPETSYVASFLGGASIVTDPSEMAALTGREELPAGKVLAVRPAGLVVAGDGVGGLPATVTSQQFLGDHREVVFATRSGLELKAHFSEQTPQDLSVGEAARITAVNPKWVLPDQ